MGGAFRFLSRVFEKWTRGEVVDYTTDIEESAVYHWAMPFDPDLTCGPRSFWSGLSAYEALPIYRIGESLDVLPVDWLDYLDSSSRECIEHCVTLENKLFEFACHIRDKVLGDPDFDCGGIHYGQNQVKPVALPEPLKIRTITAGPVFRYWLLRGLQKALHTACRSHPTMVAIGRPLLESDLERLGPLGPGEVYLSGDYKSATDLLHPDLSRAAVSAVCDFWDLDAKTRILFEEALVGASVMGQKQVWGQLMGSIVSFPILCLVNLAIQRAFFELTHAEFSYPFGARLNDLRVMVNGDDVASVIPKDYYWFWKQIVSDAGLKPSVGKNYISTEFVIINSTFYEPHKDIWGYQRFWQIPFVNLGLLLPNSSVNRSGLESEDFQMPGAEVWDLGSCSRELCKGHDYEFQDFLMTLFLADSDVQRVLSVVPRGISYFVDKRLGGLGLQRTRSGVLSDGQRAYYTRVANSMGSRSAVPEIGSLERSCLWSDFFLESDPDCPSVPDQSRESFMEWFKGVKPAPGRLPFRTPTGKDLRPYAQAWPEHNLCNFSWKYVRMELPDPFMVASACQ
jgi:hypothetical protein